MTYGFGVDLGGTTVKIAYFDQLGNMLDKWEIPTVTANEGQQILPDIAACAAPLASIAQNTASSPSAFTLRMV